MDPTAGGVGLDPVTDAAVEALREDMRLKICLELYVLVAREYPGTTLQDVGVIRHDTKLAVTIFTSTLWSKMIDLMNPEGMLFFFDQLRIAYEYGVSQ